MNVKRVESTVTIITSPHLVIMNENWVEDVDHMVDHPVRLLLVTCSNALVSKVILIK